METKDYIIYKGIANAAARVFENVICPAGEYTAKDIAKEILIHFFYKDEFYYNSVQENEKITVEFDGYKCSFPVGSAFDVCAQIETAWEIPSARRVKFVRKAETRPVAVAFDVPAAAKEIIKAIPAKFDNLRPVMNYVCIDTRRRCLIAGAANVLTAVAVPNMYVSEDAKETYLIDPLLMKSGKGTIFVDEENSVNGTQTRPNYKDRNFPSWERILPAVQDAQRINITPAVWKQLKKEITAAAKFSDNAQKLVEISGRSGCPEITVTYFRIFETAGKENSRAANISLPQPCPFDFSVQINGKQFAAVPAADSMYIYRNAQTGNVSICFAAAGAVSYLPNLDEDKDVNAAAVPAFEDAPDAAKNLLSVAAFPEIGTANSPAAAALIAAKDEETPAADSAKETRPSWEQTLPAAVVSFAFDETPAVAVSEDAQETAAAVQDEETNDAPAVPEDEDLDEIGPNGEITINVFRDWETWKQLHKYLAVYYSEETAETNAAYKHIKENGVKIIFGEIFWYDRFVGKMIKENANGVCTGVSVIWNSNLHPEKHYITRMPAAAVCPDGETPQAYIYNEETANVETPAVQDAQTLQPVAVSEDAQETPAADSVPAVAANDIETLLNKQFETYLAAAAVCLHEKEINAVDAVAVEITADEETANVQDEETAANVETPAVSLPVPVAAVYPLHAVYIDNVLHGVYFSKLLADAVLFDAFFAGRSVYPLQILSNETAPETERAAVLFAADSVPAVDEETAPAVQDEETPAVAVSVAADSETPAVAVSVAADSETPAVADSVPAVSEDAQETPANVQDEETAANVAAFVSVWACMPEIWQTDAPAVSEDAPAVAVDEETNAVPFAVSEDEETPAVANSRRRFRVWPWLIRAAAVIIAFILFAVNDAEKTPAVAVPAVQDAQETPAAVSADSLAAVLFAVPEDAPAVQDEETPAVAVSVAADSETPAVADKQPQTAKKQPQTRRKRARRAESCKQFAPDAPAVVSVADSVPADSVPAVLFAVADSLAADSLANVPAVADSLAADSLANVPAVSEDAQETAPAVQDEETDAPAVVSVPEDEETPAVADSVPAVSEDAPAVPADSVPADSVPAANSPAPAVPAVQCAPSAHVAPVAPIIL